MFGKANKTLGLDIGSKYIKGIELTRTGDSDVSVTGFGIEKVDSDLGEDQNLENFKNSSTFNTDFTCSGLSGRSVIIRYINISNEELEGLQENRAEQVSKYVPFDIKDASVDFEQLTRSAEEDTATGEGEVRVLIVAVKQETVNNHADLLERVGFEPKVVDVDALALGNAYEFYRNNNSGGAEGPIGLVDIGAKKTLVHIMRGNQSQFSREFYMGGDEFTSSIATRMGISNSEAEEKKLSDKRESNDIEEAVQDKLDDLCHEIHLSFDYFETQFDEEVEKIYVSGGGSKIQGLDGMMKKVFSKQPVFWDPLENVTLDLSNGDPQELRDNSQFFAVATGLASRILED